MQCQVSGGRSEQVRWAFEIKIVLTKEKKRGKCDTRGETPVVEGLGYEVCDVGGGWGLSLGVVGRADMRTKQNKDLGPGVTFATTQRTVTSIHSIQRRSIQL